MVAGGQQRERNTLEGLVHVQCGDRTQRFSCAYLQGERDEVVIEEHCHCRGEKVLYERQRRTDLGTSARRLPFPPRWRKRSQLPDVIRCTIKVCAHI